MQLKLNGFCDFSKREKKSVCLDGAARPDGRSENKQISASIYQKGQTVYSDASISRKDSLTDLNPQTTHNLCTKMRQVFLFCFGEL